MKRVRLLILTGLILAALAASVVPALAGFPLPSIVVELNSSFEGDKNGDNIPDKWNVKGDILRVCDHKYDSYDNCMMVVKPSGSGAALWQIIDEEGWHVVTEELEVCIGGAGFAGRINLDAERAYFGYQLNYGDGSRLTAYADVPGGTQPIEPFQVYWLVPNCPPDGLTYDLVQVKWGVVALPGDGYLGMDVLIPGPPGP